MFWGFDYFRILEIFNCDFVWALRGVRVGSDTGSSSGLNCIGLDWGQILIIAFNLFTII